jgi:hypothetical protein
MEKMSAPLSVEQLAALLNDSTTRATLQQLLDLRQANIGLFSILLCLSVLAVVAIFSDIYEYLLRYASRRWLLLSMVITKVHMMCGATVCIA